jgi:hypothetical protein
MGDSRFARCLQGGGVYVSSGTVTITSSSIYGNTAYSVRAHPQKFPMPRWETHIVLVVCRAAVSQSLEAQWPSHRAPSVGIQLPMCTLMLKSSHRPLGRLTCSCCLQGGGVYVYSSMVTITSSSIYGNGARFVRAHVQKLPLPRWENC